MRIVKKSTLEDFWKKHRETEIALRAWYSLVKKLKWEKADDIKQHFPKASIINSTRVVFNICGNNYRLVVKINYMAEIIYVRFIGTHKEYDKIKVELV